MTLKHDGKLDLALGRSRRENSWKNKQWLWSELVEKLSKTHRTAENYSQYLKEKRSRQDEIKDIGGFVGGYLTGGRRKKGSVRHRSVITLDADYATLELWEDFKMMFGCAGCIYSTHKHSPESPRYRLVIPTDREMLGDEFIAVSRRIAFVLGIDQFDHSTSYQLERLMYWPSTAADGIYEFSMQDGPWLSVDEILGSYVDWKDSSEWPTGSRENELVNRNIKKQGDPLEKSGLIGAFCRCYDIAGAIEKFLPDQYEPCQGIEDRFTYKHGSTSAGLVVYEDKFAFSHHSTDPCGGKLCNAFDLVRLHLFGLKDEDAAAGTPINKLPSYLAMCDLASNDGLVKVELLNERNAEAAVQFAVKVGQGETPPDDSWKEKLDMDRKGNCYPTINNLVLMLENDPAFYGRIFYDEFENIAIFKDSVPWREVKTASRYITDRDVSNMEFYLEKSYGISTARIEKALDVICERHSFHPVKDYLKSLTWDGSERIDTLLIDYMGAEDCEYTRSVTRKTLVAAVARVFRPGCKFDHVLTLVGEEGRGKSTIFAKIGGAWFSDTFSFHMLKEGVRAYEQIRGVWILEIGELAGMAKAEVERVKNFLSAPFDRYRQSYGRRSDVLQRQLIFVASTNKRDFLRSMTGNRRFWPVMIDQQEVSKDVFSDLSTDEIGQIWAEAVELYRGGETLYLEGTLEKEANKIQKIHTEEHPWTGVLEVFLEKKLPENWYDMQRYDRLAYLQDPDEIKEKGTVTRTRVCLLELWHEGLNKKETIGEYDATLIRNIMRNMEGWNEKNEPFRYGIYGLQRRGYLKNGVLFN